MRTPEVSKNAFEVLRLARENRNVIWISRGSFYWRSCATDSTCINLVLRVSAKPQLGKQTNKTRFSGSNVSFSSISAHCYVIAVMCHDQLETKLITVSVCLKLLYYTQRDEAVKKDKRRNKMLTTMTLNSWKFSRQAIQSSKRKMFNCAFYEFEATSPELSP